MDSITVPFLPTGLWLLTTASAIAIVLVIFGMYWYQSRRIKAALGDSRHAAELAAHKEQLQADVLELRSWIKAQKDELQRLDAERNEQEIVRSELQRLEQECAGKEENIRSLRNEAGDLENQKHLLAQSMEKIEQDKEKYSDDVQKLEALKQETEKGLEKIDTELSEKKKELNQLNGEAESQRQTMTELEKTIRQQKAELGDLEYRRNSLQKKVEDLKETEQQLEPMKKQLAKIKQDLDDTRNELSIQQRMEDEASLKVRNLRSEFEELEKKKTATNNKIDELMNNLAGQQKQHEKVAGKLEEAKNRLSDMKQELEDTKNELALQQQFEDQAARKVQEYHAVIDQLKSEEISLKASIESLKILAKKLNKQLDNEDGDSAESEDKYRDLWQPLTFPALRPSGDTPSEQQLLKTTADFIRGQKLYFPKRVLYAFHTALKISDISPIVVLAGISGTGKSELPRRYAEGMGIHPVILAVQPRWDSPQDLFGFYNYMEKRYKATELARAMVQFELYNKPLWPLPKDWDHDRSDRMLLVLLDEMNLARVEYYFSEFLSRLETRRGIIVDNIKERAKAEIALEMGSLRKGEKEIRLFPGQNVLFTGTMNEDETTQALSDKVLDRACVMRFGRPKEIKNQGDEPRIPQAINGLTFEQWKSFLKTTISPSERDRVNRWINKLNNAMEEINRPFGHRVAQAIQAYVASYPDWEPGRIQLAMADQIEQRIMPKLRGIETSDADHPLRQIQSVIEECEDQLLLAAFKQGADSQQQIFIWRGLDRTEG